MLPIDVLFALSLPSPIPPIANRPQAFKLLSLLSLCQPLDISVRQWFSGLHGSE